MFRYNAYNLKNFDKMYRECPHCGLKYEVEPGFYTGAMYISYAFSVAIFVITGFSLYVFLNDPDIMVYVITTLVIIVLLFPILFRLSRVIYLHLFGGVDYRPGSGGPLEEH